MRERQTMLFLAFATCIVRISAVAVIRRQQVLSYEVAKAFPMVDEIVEQFCGASSGINLTADEFMGAAPCRAGAFGFAVAFSSCSAHHGGDAAGFRSCVDGCANEQICSTACVGGSIGCPTACTAVAACIQQAAAGDSTGRVSSEDQVRDCLEMMGLFSKSFVPASINSGVAASLVAVRKSFPVAPTVNADACACTSSERVLGLARHNSNVTTGWIGCARHGGEPAANATDGAYCFIEGGTACVGAQPSVQFPGVYWIGCTTPNFHVLYADGCELREPARPGNDWPQFPALNMSVPPTDHNQWFDHPTVVAAAYASGAPVDLDPILQDLHNAFNGWQTTLSPEWHARVGNLFLSPTTTTSTTMAFVAAAPAPAPAPAAMPAMILPVSPSLTANSGAMQAIR